MTKHIVSCPICELSLGRFHANASAKPLARHIYRAHPEEYAKIVQLISEIDDRYDVLRGYGVNQWTKHYFRDPDSLEAEMYLEENPPAPLSPEARADLVKRILGKNK